MAFHLTDPTQLLSDPAALTALLLGSVIFLFVALVIYIYLALALMGIAKKTKTKNA